MDAFVFDLLSVFVVIAYPICAAVVVLYAAACDRERRRYRP